MRTFYVAPGGSDANDGTVDNPLGSLAGARDAVRAFKAANPVGDILVYLRGGTYTLDETVVFGTADSGGAEQTITYAAYPGERPVISSGQAIDGWRRLAEPPAELPAAAADHVWVADLPPGRSFKSLYDGGTMVPRARGASFAPTAEGTPQELRFPAGALRNWPNLSDVELVISPRHWMVNILPLASVDEVGNVATTAVPGRYQLGANRQARSASIENVIDVLDTPGEWVLNSQTGTVYYWPADGRPGDVRAPLLTELVLVEGDIDYDGPEDTPVTHLVFRGLTFTQADRDTYPAHYLGRDLQHAWDLQDRGNALIRFRGVAHSAVEDSIFTQSGQNAIRCDLTCHHNRFSGNLVHDVGASGIILAGYGGGTKDANHHNLVENNEVRDVGRLYPHGIAIWAWQSGSNRIAHNLVHHVPYTGIAVSGRIRFDPTQPTAEAAGTIRWDEIGAVTDVPPTGWEVTDYFSYEPFLYGRDNVVEYNDISQVMTTFHDGNAIYVSGAALGNVVRRNYIHDIDSPNIEYAYRTDDHQYGTLFTENVIAGLAHGGGLAHKQRNDMTNNVIAELADPPAYLRLILPPATGSKLRHNVYYSTQAGQRILQEGPSYRPPVPRLTDTDSDFNTYYSTADASWGPDFLRPYQSAGFELNSLSADPMFYDPAQDDFRMRPGSLVAATGFTQLDPAAPGLTADFPHAPATDPLERLFVRAGEQFSAIRLGHSGSVPLQVSGRTENGYVADLARAPVNYSSSDPDVATVDDDGVVHAVAAGSAEIAVSATLDGADAATSIVVTVGVDNAALRALADHGEALLAAAEPGTGPGEYPQQAIDTLASRVASARSLLDDADAAQSRIDAEARKLNRDLEAFKERAATGCENVLPDGRIVYDDSGGQCPEGARITYSGAWASGAWDGAYGGTRHYSNARGAAAELTFQGTGVALMTQLRPGHGIALVSVDGGPAEEVDTYSATAQERVLAWERSELPAGEHTVRVEVSGDADPAASNAWVVIDAVVVTP
ncbi:hypothetical protein E1269_09740 [Jiangella asiatica]|uniref:BIG2 domain-containing protein n=1 Tax=Jiangella asiatica TaxID=2530372 RepID=A0A4R5DBS0_9ACTN|nr:hypothetical protein E1269_09740 [Jiangella asiatica]